MLGRRRQRFPGAGGSADRQFNRELKQNIRREWKVWFLGACFVLATAIYSFYVGRVGGRFFAWLSGVGFGAFVVIASMGGNYSTFRWWLGAEGERETAKQIETLGEEWHCEHDLEHEGGNYDHVLVGPAGVFLLDSKFLQGASAARGDALRSGRVVYPGAASRGGAKRVKVELERRLGLRAPWVQSVVVVWGEFPQARHEEQDVVYVSGDDLVPWLSQLPGKLNAPQRARGVHKYDPAAIVRFEPRPSLCTARVEVIDHVPRPLTRFRGLEGSRARGLEGSRVRGFEGSSPSAEPGRRGGDREAGACCVGRGRRAA